jgi:hypothetical protein
MCKYHDVTKKYSKCTKHIKHQVTKKNIPEYCGGDNEGENCPRLEHDGNLLGALVS